MKTLILDKLNWKALVNGKIITALCDYLIIEDKEDDMMVEEDLIGKTAVVVWEQYIKNCKQGFVLDDEVDWSLLENEFEQIKELDPDAKAYACTYSIEYNDNGMYMYCDNLWLKTKLF